MESRPHLESMCYGLSINVIFGGFARENRPNDIFIFLNVW